MGQCLSSAAFNIAGKRTKVATYTPVHERSTVGHQLVIHARTDVGPLALPYTDRQTDRQTDRPTDGWTDGGQTKIQIDR